MITITVLRNPFNHTDKEIHSCEYIAGKTAYEYVQPYIMGLDEFVVSIGGNVVDNVKEQHVNDEDWIAVCPVVGKSGKAWFRAIAMIALSVAVNGWSNSWATKWGAKEIFGSTANFWAHMAAGAVSAIGGTLINHWFPAAKADRYEINPSYNWSNAQPLTDQGNALAVTYGTMRTSGQVLAQHVSNDGDNQYLNLLLCGGEGLIDSISDIRINDNPVSYYKDIDVETRLGVNDQTSIANFNDTYIDQALAYEINNDNKWITQQTDGNAVEGLEVTLEFPYGLYYAKDSGGLGNASVTLQAQYNKVGDDNWRNFTDGMSWAVTQNSNGYLKMISVNSVAPKETWTITYGDHGNFIVSGSVSGVKPNAKIYNKYNNGLIAFNIMEYWGENRFVHGDTFTINVTPDINLQIAAAKNTSFFRTYRVDSLPAAQYEVRVKCSAKSGTNNRYSTRVFWTQMSNIIYDDFARPGKVLIGIKALATNQLSGGMPNITWLQTRNKVWVWNADSGQYEQKSATNPAWAAYDMIHRCRQIKNIHTGNLEFIVKGTPASRAVYQDFARWAAFCDSRNLTFNYIFNTATDLWTSLQKPEGVGRGKVIMRGTRYGCVCDAPGEPVQLFTVGNILTDKFQETFVGLKDRANAIEVTFANKDKAYQKEVITAYADDYDNTTEPNITQITLDGVTSVEQAYREAKYRLRLNQYLQRTVEHSADIDAIACQINDVVLLAHDVPQWGYSGRLLAATATTLQLDREVTLRPGKSYTVALQITNPSATTPQEAQSIVTVGVQGVVQEISTDTLTLTSPLSHVPQQWDLYSFGETSKVVKPFRVLSISQDQDLRRKISCIEYIEAVYTEASDIPEVNYSALETTTEISNVSVAEETYLQKDGTMASNLNVAWSIPRDKLVSGYKVLYSSDNGQTWSEWATGITALSTKIIGVKTQTTYLVKVCTISYVGVVSNGIVSISVYVTGKDAYPSDVAGLSANISPSDCTKITLTWPAVTDIDLRGYQLMEGSTVLTPTPISDTQYIYTATQSRVHNFSVRAIDNSGNPSEIPATESISIIVEPTQVAGFSVVIQETDRSKLLLSWTANSEKDIAYYEIRTGNTDWDAATVIATQLKATSYLHSLTAEGSQTFMIRAYNVSGKDSLIESSKTVQVILRPDTPIGLVVEQDPQNRSIAILSWNASPGKDIEGYQITVGSQIYFTRELFYRYTLPTSGTYNFSIRAKTVAANYSNAANISLTAMIDPYDVTGFAAQQSITDRTIVTLIWDNPISKDVAYFEIRMGNNWDTGQVIASRATGTFHEVQVLDENRHTFFIKALSVAGNYSQNAAEVEGIFNLNPSPVSNIKISQNPNDRSQLIITWTGISESDLAFYDVRIGYEWDTATKIAETKETRWTHQTDNTGDIKAMIKSKNAAGFYSDEVYEHYYSTVEPGTVTGLVAIQNGEYVELFWDKHSESDVVAYEITEGASFDMGQLVVSGVTTTEYKVKVDTERNYYYHVKAINRALKYSQIAASYGVYVGNLPVKNIIQEYDEIVLQTGTKYNAEFGPSLINWSNMGGRFSDYPTTKFSDVGGQTVLKLKQVNLLDTPTKRIPAVYNNYPANITSSLIISPETFKGQPIHRLTLTPINATGVTQLSTIAVGHGFWYNTSLQYLMNESFLASIYWRTTTSKPVSMSGTSSNISGWTSIGTTDAGGGWSRTVSKRLYATTQSDYKYWSIMCPTVTLNEAVTIEFTCPQIEVNTSVTEFGTYFSTGEYTCQTKDMNQVITANITSDFRSTVILRGIGSAVLQIRTSQDGTNWLAWQDFKPAQYTFRYLDARVLLATNDPTNTPEVNHLSLRIDVPDTDKAGTITIPIGGVTVNYGHTYYEIPVLTPMAIGDNRFPVILTKTKSSFTAKITDRAGTDTGGALDWRSKGY